MIYFNIIIKSMRHFLRSVGPLVREGSVFHQIPQQGDLVNIINLIESRALDVIQLNVNGVPT